MIFLRKLQIIHLAIDIQEQFLEYLEPKHADRFPGMVREFADHLREKGIPTIWVAYCKGRPSALYTEITSIDGEYTEKGKILIVDTGIVPPLRWQEEIFVKQFDDAFFGDRLQFVLRRREINTLIITGMNTCCCVAETIKGAAVRKFNCVVVNNLLADPDSKDNPEWHENVIINRIGYPSKLLRRIKFVTASYTRNDAGNIRPCGDCRKSLFPDARP